MSISNSDWGGYLSNLPTNGSITGTGITSGVANNVWPNISETDRLAGGTLYRKTFFKNNNGTDAAVLPVVWFPVAPTNMTLVLGIGIDNSADSDSAQGNMTAWTSSAKVALISTAADVRVVTIIGMDNSGTPVPVTENVTLTGAVEVLSTLTYSKVWAVIAASTNANTVTVKQGTGGTTRGTFASGKLGCWLWVAAGTAKSSGIALPNLAFGASIGVWHKLTWIAGATAIQPNTLSVEVQENG